MATRLWKSSCAADWDAQWARYSTVLASLQKDKLVVLDAWFQNDLPTALHSRDPKPFLTQAELVQLMEWKLKKGKWRPQLMKFVENLSDAEVRSTSLTALSAYVGGDGADTLKAAVQTLAELKGVGPATASAVLAAYDNKAPFMGDEALEAIAHVIGARKYTLAHYMAFAAQLAQKAAWLREQAAANSNTETDADSGAWSAQRVQLCLYAAAHDSGGAADDSGGAADDTPVVAATPKLATKAKAAAKPKAASPKAQSDKSPPARTRSSSRRAAAANTRRSDDGADGGASEREEAEGGEATALLVRKRRRTSAPQQ